jgi:hypothetical protein
LGPGDRWLLKEGDASATVSQLSSHTWSSSSLHYHRSRSVSEFIDP